MSLFKSFKLHLKKSGETLNISKARNILDVLIEEGIEIDYACQNVFCGRCAVTVLEGADNLELISALEEDVKIKCNLGENQRLTCKLRMKGDVTIEL
ncbi:MAG: hypothetical protein COA79_03255 [Planctomycetota bacterium]|nr:MAG: hypothetical protein COA79_03255 [Planctomycetota bacterium]